MAEEYPTSGNIYKVLKSLTFTAGSDIYNISGTHIVTARKGNTIEFLSFSYEGTSWWRVNGQRVRYDGNYWCPALRNSLKRKMI